MKPLERRWALMQGEMSLGTLELRDLDQPWWYCAFTPTAAFDDVRPLFVTEWRASEASDWEAADRAYDAILILKLRLVEDDGEVIDSMLLHIDGDDAWFRY